MSALKFRAFPTPMVSLDSIFAGALFFFLVALGWSMIPNDLIAPSSAGYLLGAETLGVLPPPGVPLYLTLTHVLTRLLPFGSLVWRMNAAGVLCLAAAAVCVYQTGRQLYFAPPVSASAALTFAAAPFVWHLALAPAPEAFHLFLISLSVWGALALLRHREMSLSSRQIAAWAMGAGAVLCAGAGTWPWILALSLLLLATWPSSRVRARLAWLALGCGVLGAIVPFVYLPLRVISPAAYLNMDTVPHFLEWRRLLSPSLLASWLGWYFLHGPQAPAVMAAGAGGACRAWLCSISPLALAAMIFGFLLNSPYLLWRKPRAYGETEYLSRVLVSNLVFMAAAGLLLAYVRAPWILGPGLTLAGAYSLYAALNYAWLELGQRTLPATKIKNPLPTAFGWIILILVPALTAIQGALAAPRWQPAASPESNLSAVRAGLSALPLQSTLIFPTAALSYPYVYAQRLEGLRPDLTLLPFSAAWPNRRFSGLASLEILGRGEADRRWRRMQFADYWNRAAQGEAERRPVWLMLARGTEDDALAWFLESFPLEPAPSGESGSRVFPRAYRVLPFWPTLSEPDAARGEGVGSFGDQWRLLGGSCAGPADDPLLAVTLTWRRERGVRPQRYTVDFWILPAAAQPETPGDHAAWMARRHVLAPTAVDSADTRFAQTYQLLVPAGLRPGSYAVWAGVRDAGSRQPLAASDGARFNLHSLLVCTFSVGSGQK